MPNIVIDGWCSTAGTFPPGRAGQAAVVFTERWPWEAFRYAGSPKRTQHHSWRVVVLANGKAASAGSSGDFPPQWVA